MALVSVMQALLLCWSQAQEENREPIIILYFRCHVFGHALCKNKTNIKIIQEIMGHANIFKEVSDVVLQDKNRTEQYRIMLLPETA